MASPGMMQSGLSRELFEAWCTDHKNGVIIGGYCVEGTIAKQVSKSFCFYFIINRLRFAASRMLKKTNSIEYFIRKHSYRVVILILPQ